MGMSTRYVLAGRTRQKQRTRDALIAAARELVADGQTPTVEEAAEAAAISRTTAYRYFANQGELLSAAHSEIDRRSLLPDPAPPDPASRLDAVVVELTRIILDTERQQRTMLRLSLDPGRRGPLLLRQGRAIGWIEEALAPLKGRLSDARIRRLALAVRSATGIEALVWLTDVGRMSRKEAARLMRWSAAAMLRAAMVEIAGAR
jgi:AcrR family transcriptional regulator